MLGFNGGLIGIQRSPSIVAAPGVWSAEEQLFYQRTANWPRTFILEAFTGSAAAFSLRKLSPTVTNVVRVRRSSDNTEQDFTADQITDGTLTTFCGAGNGFVRTWYDQSGNAAHAQQATTANQPQIVSSGTLVTTAGKPSLQYDGAGDILTASITNLSSATAFSLFVVNQPANATVADTTTAAVFSIAAGGADTSNLGIQYGATTNLLTGETISFFHSNASFAGRSGRLGTAGYTQTANQQLLHSVILTTTNTRAYKNAAELTLNLTANSMTSTTNNAPSSSGALNNNLHLGQTAGTNGVVQKVQEYIVFLSDRQSNRANIETYINNFYGIY